MTTAEALTSIRAIVAEYRARPQQFLSGHVVLVVTRTDGRAPRGERMRVLPGVLGRVLCVNANGGIVVDVEVAALERWIALAEAM